MQKDNTQSTQAIQIKQIVQTRQRDKQRSQWESNGTDILGTKPYKF